MEQTTSTPPAVPAAVLPEPHGSLINTAARHIMAAAHRATYGLDANLERLEIAELMLWNSDHHAMPSIGMYRLLVG